MPVTPLDRLGERLWRAHASLLWPTDPPAACVCSHGPSEACLGCGRAACPQCRLAGQPEVWCAECTGAAVAAVNATLQRMEEGVQRARAWLGGLLACLVAALLWAAVAVVLGVQSAVTGLLMGWLVGLSVMAGAGHKRGRSLQAIAAGFGAASVCLGLALQNVALMDRAIRVEGYPWLPWSTRLGMSLASLPQLAHHLGPLFWLVLTITTGVAWYLPAPGRRLDAPGAGTRRAGPAS